MHITLENGVSRRMAWTDKKNGYLVLMSSSVDMPDCGYWRGDKRFLSDFFIPMRGDETDLYRTNASRTEVKPEGFTSFFETGSASLALDISLLIDEQAFYVNLESSAAGGAASGAAGDADASAGVGILFGKEGSSPVKSGTWQTVRSPDGITCWQNDDGMAVASALPFTVEVLDAFRICLFPERANAPWYVVFGTDGNAAREKAIRLAQTDAISFHRAKIAEFFEGCTLDSGDSRFNDAVKWAQFSGWMFVNDDHGPGIWAGLPWFRDNWGRDTCLALCGILLVPGRFAEARAVLAGLARRQNRDRKSPDWGRIPNRYRDEHDIIYNTADGTLWFIRSLWEYLQYTGDLSILGELGETVDIALEADSTTRTDDRGFLLHGDADTWMDARIRGGTPFSPRGNRACEIQALWYTALLAGSEIARLRGNEALAAERGKLAARVRESFRAYFWCGERNALADRLPPGEMGEWLRDFRVRPNQLLALTAPAVFSPPVPELLDGTQRKQVIENVSRELVSPYGLFSLSPDDPLFHPKHENPGFWHKDAAYHNGTIWLWTTGPFVTASVLSSASATLPPAASALLYNESVMILDAGCVGTLGENIHAEPDGNGDPVFSGTWSQAWSVAEFSRNVYQDVTGFNPRLADGLIELHPHLPSGIRHWSAEPPFGPGWRLHIDLDLNPAAGELRCVAVWKNARVSGADLPSLRVNGLPILPGIPLELAFPATADGPAGGPATAPDVPVSGGLAAQATYRTKLFPERDFTPDWCGSIHQKDYLEKLAPRGISHALSLEWLFDSDWFKRKYLGSLPLGAIYSGDHTVFRLWAPTARSVSLILYPDGDRSPPTVVLPMQNGRGLPVGSATGRADAGSAGIAGAAGFWELAMTGDLHGVYYCFRVRAHGIVRDSADPQARACGVNGKRSMVVDFIRTNPAGWNKVQPPALVSPNDAVVYEAHVADITSSPSWNGDPRVARTFAGAALRGTAFRGNPTGFDHLLALGITHVQLMPVFDFSSVDENRLHDASYGARLVGGVFNWGYDPENWNAPEGSYSTDPRGGVVRIRELKGLIREFLSNGIGVIMDVVYNHVPSAQNHPAGICVPGYFFRARSFSGAGDDTASEREMFRSYMIDSLSWWLSEYKLSGFRFDLMGLHDVETMNEIAAALRRIKGDVLLYGEGWDMYRGRNMVGASMLQSRKLPGWGFFNDAFRCGIKGSIFSPHEGGFIHNGSHREAVKFGLVGAVYHPQVHNRFVDGTANPNPWTALTGASVNYTEIHDNSTLYDKLVLVEPGKSEAYYGRLQRTAIALVLFAQGMPILHAGMEFMRTKEIPPEILEKNTELADLYRTSDGIRAFSHNSYNLSDIVNGLDWMRCAAKRDLVDYVRRLIAVRKAHPLFRLRTEEEVVRSLCFVDLPEPLLGWVIDGCLTVDPWRRVCLIVNPGSVSVSCRLPPCGNGGAWHAVTDGDRFADDAPPLHPAGAGVFIEPKALYLYAEF